MNASEFDGLLRRRYEQHEFAYQPEDWAKLKAQLDKELPERTSRSRPFFFLLLPGMAASVAAIACGVYLFQNTGKFNTRTAVPSQAGNMSARPAHSVRMASEIPTAISTSLTAAVATPVAAAAAPVTEHEQKPAIVLPAASAEKSTMPATDKPVRSSASSVVVVQNKSNSTASRSFDRIDFTMFVAEDEKNKTTSVSVGGGVNYGSMNAGYMVGVNARKNFNSRLFIEGDVAMVNNATTRYKETVTPGESNVIRPNARMAEFAKITNNTPLSAENPTIGGQPVRNVESQNTNLYYIQVAPTIGYQLYPELSVGFGPDFQQLLQSNEKKVIKESNNQAIESLPAFDMGLQAKAEISISRKLRAGLQYRKGINTMLQKSSIDRNYMQVQIKYTMFNR